MFLARRASNKQLGKNDNRAYWASDRRLSCHFPEPLAGIILASAVGVLSNVLDTHYGMP